MLLTQTILQLGIYYFKSIVLLCDVYKNMYFLSLLFINS